MIFAQVFANANRLALAVKTLSWSVVYMRRVLHKCATRQDATGVGAAADFLATVVRRGKNTCILCMHVCYACMELVEMERLREEVDRLPAVTGPGAAA